MKINENELAKSISLHEGKLKSLSIGQIKECLKIVLDLLSKEDVIEVLLLLKKHKK